VKLKNLIVLILGLFLFFSCSATEKKAEANTEFKIWKISNDLEGAEAYFSPDGKSMIFNAKTEQDSTFLVYTMNIDGTNLKRINDKGEDACSFYHPNGKELIWTSTRDNMDMPTGSYSKPNDYPQGAELYLSDLDGNNVKRLTNNKYYDAEVSISPDETKILFGRQIDGKMDLWVMDIDGNNEKQITFTEEWQEGGAFYMPDSKTILYRAWKISDQDKRGMPMTIFTIEDDGTNLKQITHDDGTNWAPYPSADGKHFVFVRILPPHNFEIFLMNIENGQQTRLTYNDAFDGFPTISPDGKTLSFSSSRAAKPGERKLELFLMDISSLNLGE